MNKYAIQQIYQLALHEQHSNTLRMACIKALKTSSKIQKFGSDESHANALNNLSPSEQQEVKIGIFTQITNKIKSLVETEIGQDVLETITDLINTSGISHKINKIETKLKAPSNEFEKMISDKAKSYAKASDALAFIARLTQAEKPEDIVKALDVSMDELEQTIMNVTGESVGGFIKKKPANWYRHFYKAIADIKEVSKLYTVELAVTLLEISIVGGIGMFLAGNHDVMSIFGNLWHGVKEVITLVIVSVILMNVKDSAQFIRKQDIFIKAIPVVLMNDLIRVLKWSWSKVVSFFSDKIDDVSDFFSDWLGNDSKTASNKVFLETLKLAKQNPHFQNQLLQVIS